MEGDIVAELSARTIAHNIARRFPVPVDGEEHEIEDYAQRLAELFDGDTRALRDAGLALWRVIYGKETGRWPQ